MEEGSAPDRAFLLILGALGLFILSSRHFAWRQTLKKNYFIVLIVFYMLISTVWSTMPAISLRRWGREMIALIIAFLLLSERSPLRALISVIFRVIYLALPYSLLLIKYYGEYGWQYDRFSGELMWVGIAGQKNGLALICSFSAIFLIWSLWRDLSQWNLLSSKTPIFINLLMLILSIYLMMGPKTSFRYSSTSFLCLLIGIISIILLKTSINKRIKNKIIILAIIIILLGTLMPFLGKFPIKGIPEILGRDSTLTGRTQIWRALVPYAQKKLIFGHGFGGFWTTSLVEQISISSHNGYLDTILHLGLIGLIGFSIFLVSFILKCYKLMGSAWDITILFISIIFMFLIHNISETSLGHLSSFPSSLIILSFFVINDAESNITNNSEEKPSVFL